MNPERYQQAKQLLQEAIQYEPEQRSAFVAEACGDDQGLRHELESLLAHAEAADGFIEVSAVDVAARVMADEDRSIAGRRIGPYELIREIGRGGMGAVYLAKRADEQYEKLVAIKLVKRGLDSQDVRRRFLHERQILASLDHPNIARLIDGGTTDDGLPFFVMEYVAGRPINEFCDEHRLSPDERLNLFRTVCSAVHYAHQHLVIHRDIKPGNILITEDGTPKLVDFGIAKLLDPTRPDATAHTVTQLGVMTPEYASPEQVKGENITTASDVYSLGVLLYELLTGHRPYRLKGHRPDEIARMICEVEPNRPSTAVTRTEQLPVTDGQPAKTITPESVSEARSTQPEKLRRVLDGDLDNIVLMAMRKEFARRYSSVQQFSEDILRHMDGLPVIARKDTFAYRASKFVKRNRITVAVGVVAALVLVAGIAGIAWQARVAARQARIATQERDHARVETAKAERINQFLQDTLGFADQGWFNATNGKGPNATIGEALEQASRRAETELADQPEVLASVLFTIGMAQFNRAKFDLAEQYLRKCWDLRRKTYGDDNPQTARAAAGVAEVLILKSDYNGAEALLQQALTTYRKRLADGSVQPVWVVWALDDLGLLKVGRGQPAAGEPFLREALNFSPKLAGTERTAIAIAFSNLGQARVAQGDLEEGERLYRSSIDEYRKLPGRERPELATTLSFLGDLLKTKGQYAESEAALREALEVARRLTGENSPNVSLASGALAHLLYLKGDYAEAESAVNKALQICKLLLPEGHLGFSGPMTTQGLIMNRTGRSIQAESILRKALAIRTRILPKGHWQIAFTQGALGECLTTQKRYAEAEPLLIESHHDLKASQGAQNPRTAEASQRLVKLYEAWGKSEKAAPYR